MATLFATGCGDSRVMVVEAVPLCFEAASTIANFIASRWLTPENHRVR